MSRGPVRPSRAPSPDVAAVARLNRERVVGFFRSGANAKGEGTRLGVEVEHFVIADDGEPLHYERHDGYHGVRELLEGLGEFYPDAAYAEGGELIGLAGSEGSVSLEPAAQIELSAAPRTRVAEVGQAFEHFYEHVDSILGPWGARLETYGYNPTSRAVDLPLIPKRRYELMDRYFHGIGTHGERMMRGSASTQVSVDFRDEADAVRKMRVAEALSPVLAAIMDNTPVFEGEPTARPLHHLRLWRDVDDARCGVPRGLFEDGFGFEAYADWLLSVPPTS